MASESPDQSNHDFSESNMSEMCERPEASESGIITEMEHQRSQSMTAVEIPTLVASDDGQATTSHTNQQKQKAKRGLGKRVAKGIKKQLKKSDKKDKSSSNSNSGGGGGGRDTSPLRIAATFSHDNTNSGSDSEGDETHDDSNSPTNNNNNNNNNTGAAAAGGEPKKKHKSKFKPVAKAAAAAAKKIAGKKSSSKQQATTTATNNNRDRIQSSDTNTSSIDQVSSSSTNSSRANSPINLLPAASMGSKTPVNTPVHSTTLIDGRIPEHVMKQFPTTLAECGEEEDDYDDEQQDKKQPAVIHPAISRDSSEEQQQTTMATAAAVSHTTTKTTTVSSSSGVRGAGGTVDSTTTTTTVPAPPQPPSEDDMIRLAEAMAMAVEKNPTKSHEEIRRMVLNQPEFQHLTPPDMMTTTTTTAAASASSSTGGGTSSSSTSTLLKKNFFNLQTKITTGAGTAQKKLMEMATGSLESTLGGSVTSFPFGKGGGSSGTTTAAGTTKTSDAAATTMDTTTTSATAPSGDAATTISPTTSETGVTPASTTTNIPENTAANMESSVSTTGAEGSLHDSSISLSLVDQQQQPVTITPVTEKAIAAPPSMPSPAVPAPGPAPPTVTFAPKITAAAAPPIAPSSPVPPVPTKKAEPPIKLTDIVWKRRSGFGKFSASSAWERRRFVLQGNVLSYFRAHPKGGGGGDNSNSGDTNNPMDDMTERLDDNPEERLNASVSVNLDAIGKSSKSSTKQRMMEALDYATANLGLSSSGTSSDKPTEMYSARGSMDLIKENATICATLGHSGAPSPFCLSIKVKGETKWKLCFASHRSQLQWLAAITDVIVQASLDTYNVQLLSAADPNQDIVTAAFHSHVQPPPSNDDIPPSQRSLSSQTHQLQQQPDSDNQLLPQPSKMHISGRRLWMMEPYVIRSQNEVPPQEKGPESDDDEASTSSAEYEDDREDAVAAAKKVAEEEDDRNIWSLPEKNLPMAAVLVNAAILYARNSTMSAQAFWTAVTIANMALFAFLESTPPQSSANTGAPAPGGASQRQAPGRRKRKKEGVRGAGSSDEKGTAAGSKPKKKAFLPMAGMTAIRVENPSDPGTNSKGETFLKWRQLEGEHVQVRSRGYMTTKAKIPSPGTLYELSQMDIFDSPARYPDMAPRVKLPNLSCPTDPDEAKTWKAPDHFVVSLSLPTDPPKLGNNTSDGGGYTITMYFSMRKTTRDILKRVTADGYDPASEVLPADIQKSQVNAVRLFEEWCRRAANDIKFQTRFKMIPHVENAKEIGLPSWIGKYNGKPLLIKRPGQTGFLFQHPQLSCIEFDISLHVFPYLAKQGICYLKDSLFKKMLASVAFVIEGREDDELPECVIGVGQVCYPDPENAMQAADFFAGTACRSFEPPEEKPALDPSATPAVTKPTQDTVAA